ncbi:MAG: hypothetical protein LWW85_13320, partial [Marinilabiliales bacterium]|nr:hypothetical protein [Marinilabiliales bacterium]
MTVVMSTKLELPAMRERRQEEMRQNISKLNGEIKADSVIRRNFPMFHFGMADWSVIATHTLPGNSDTRLNLALGSILGGGEFNAYLNYDSKEVFSEKQQNYYWKFVNNFNPYIRQTTIGKINVEAISSLYNPVLGIKFTNTPTIFRRSFGSYPLSDYTNPGWIVELYVNNVLVDYAKADGSGFFSFQVPLVYGNSNVKLKFYGPWGEERSREQQITIPFNFLPPGEFEYTMSAGMVEDDKQSMLARGEMHYGLNSITTLGAGVEYFSNLGTEPIMPFVNLALRPISNMMVS